MINLKNILLLPILIAHTFAVCIDEVDMVLPNGQTIIARPTSPDTTYLLQGIYRFFGVENMTQNMRFFSSEDERMTRADITELGSVSRVVITHEGSSISYGQSDLGEEFLILSPMLNDLIRTIEIDSDGSGKIPVFLAFQLLSGVGNKTISEEDLLDQESHDNNNYVANKFAVEHLTTEALHEFLIGTADWNAMSMSEVPDMVRMELIKRTINEQAPLR